MATTTERPKRTIRKRTDETQRQAAPPSAATATTRIELLRSEDLLAAAQLMHRTVDDIRRTAGLEPLDFEVKSTPPLLQHIYEQDPELSWGAYDGETLVGFATSHIRDHQWHVAYQFVETAHQNRGIGGELLRTGLGVARERGAMITSQCTFTYNPKAIALYTRLGLFPRKNLILLEGPRCSEMKCPDPPRSIEPSVIDSTSLLNELNHMDREVRGINRSVDHCYWLADEDYTGYVFRANNSLVGYAYISRKGFIAPALAIRDIYLVEIVNHCLHLLKAQYDVTPRIWLNGKNFASLTMLLNHGFRIKEIALLMTNRMFCDMRRYIPASLAVF
jgi:GNAT superfamily N-acetyltransferase